MRYSNEEKTQMYIQTAHDGQEATAAANATFVLIKQVAHEQIATAAAAGSS